MLKFHIILKERIMIDLKTFLSSAIPNQCCWFWGDILGLEIPNLHDPYTVQYIMNFWLLYNKHGVF